MIRTMWFGPRGYEAWIKMPRIDMDSTHAHVGQRLDQIRGGVSIIDSGAGHQEYGISWNPATRDEVALIDDIVDGIYGDDLIYFIDPAAQDKNLLPRLWAAPMLCAKGAPSLTKGVKPTLSATPANTLRLPAQSATFNAGSSNLLELYVPIPPGHRARWAFYGPTAQTNRIQYRNVDSSGVVSSWITSDVRANSTYGTMATASAGNQGIFFRLAPSAGATTLTTAICQVYPDGKVPPTPSRYISGRGHSGCKVEPGSRTTTVHNVYYDRVSTSVRLVEVGSWL